MGADLDTDSWVLDVEVVGLRREADGVLSLELADPLRRLLPVWEPGAHIDLYLPGVVRQYSLCGDPAERRLYRVAVLREPASRGGSSYIHDRLRVGDQLEIGGPRNHFPLVDAQRYLLIAGGIGITPLLPMMAALESQRRDWRLMYGGRTRGSMAFRPQLVARYGDRVEIRPQNEYGLLDLDELLGTPAEDAAVYCCGPEPLLAAVEQRCEPWPAGALHVERFSARPVDPGMESHPFELVLERSGQRLTVPPDRSALEVLEEAGIPVANACREGVCGSCLTRVLCGTPDHRDSLTDRARTDVVMPCVSRAKSAELVVDL